MGKAGSSEAATGFRDARLKARIRAILIESGDVAGGDGTESAPCAIGARAL